MAFGARPHCLANGGRKARQEKSFAWTAVVRSVPRAHQPTAADPRLDAHTCKLYCSSSAQQPQGGALPPTASGMALKRESTRMGVRSSTTCTGAWAHGHA